jgi:ADP-L-glycero-D-manno-heptose 6-epimerase
VKYTDVDFNGKTVLITGGAGFIGSNLALYLQSHYPDCRIVVFDAFLMGHFQNLRGFRGQCISGDIGEREDLRLLAPYRFDYIFHQAAISDTTVSDQKRMVHINTNVFRWLLEWAAAMSTPVVYASSAGVYGNSPPPHRVGHGEQPENVYGFSKLMMDHVAVEFAARHKLPVVGLRYFNVFGPREFYKGRTASMILQLGLQMLAGQPPRLFKHGEQQRDFVYVEDVVQANLRGAASGRSGVFNVGSGTARSFNDVLNILRRVLNIELPTEYVDNPWSFYQQHTEADINTTRQMLGYAPRYSLESGIEAYAGEIRRLAGGKP